MIEKKEKKILIFLLIVFIAIFINSAYNIYHYTTEISGEKNNVSYTTSSKVEYFVYVEKNDFIVQKVLRSGSSYISSITEKLNMMMNYQYSSKKEFDISSKYSVSGVISAYYNLNPAEKYENPKIWSKEFEIKESTSKEYKNTKEFTINESFDLDWKKINQEIDKFKENFSIPILARLEINMTVLLDGKNEKYDFEEKKVISASIPLSELIFSVETTSNDSEEKTVTPNDIENIQDGQRKIFLFSVSIVIVSFAIIFTLNKILSYKNIKTFDKKIEEIKKDYNDIVVETKNMINTKGLKPIAITSFDELLNLAESLVSPIMLYKENKLACFYIVKADVIYMFIIKNKPIKNS